MTNRHLPQGTSIDWPMLLDKIDHVRTWLSQAPIDEIEAVERALGQNAPIQEADEAMAIASAMAPSEVT